MKLHSILSPEAVFPHLECASKKQALKALSEHAEALTGVDAGEIFDVLMEREHKSGTGVGDGAAVPHGRFEALTKTCMLFATLKRPIEFGAFDGKPVDILFTLLVPTSAHMEHVKGMALATRLLRDKKLCQALRVANDADTLYAILTARAEDA